MGSEDFLKLSSRRICTTMWPESDLEVKTVIAAGAWDLFGVFGGSNCVSRGRRRDFGTLQNTRQAQEFGFEEGPKRCSSRGRRRDRALQYRWLKPRMLNPWKGCKFHATEMLLCGDHFAWQFTGLRMLRLNSFVAGAIFLKRPPKNR